MKVIAEIGCNHCGKMGIANKMIHVLAHYCEVDIVKFQKRTIKLLSDEVYNRPYENSNSYGKTYGEHRKNLEFNILQHKELKSICFANGVEYSCSVWDLQAAEEIISIMPDKIKIPSARNRDKELIDYVYKNFEGEIHISLGMTTRNEKSEILSRIDERTVIYHCVSAYPVEFKDVYLKNIENYPAAHIGYSGHHRGIAVDVAALTMGIDYLERHFTLDRTWKGTDHAASLEPEGMKRLVRDVKNVSLSLRKNNGELLECETKNREKLK